MKKIFVFILAMIATTTYAQELKTLTLEDLNFGGNNYHNMVPKHRYTTWWGNELIRTDVEDCYIVDKKFRQRNSTFLFGEY